MLCCVQSPRADVPGDSPEGSDAARDLVARRTPPSERTFPRGYRAPPMPSPGRRPPRRRRRRTRRRRGFLLRLRRRGPARPREATPPSTPTRRSTRRLSRRRLRARARARASQKRRKRGRRRTRAKILLERSRPPQARDPPGVHPETPPGRVRTGDVHEGRGRGSFSSSSPRRFVDVSRRARNHVRFGRGCARVGIVSSLRAGGRGREGGGDSRAAARRDDDLAGSGARDGARTTAGNHGARG